MKVISENSSQKLHQVSQRQEKMYKKWNFNNEMDKCVTILFIIIVNKPNLTDEYYPHRETLLYVYL